MGENQSLNCAQLDRARARNFSSVSISEKMSATTTIELTLNSVAEAQDVGAKRSENDYEDTAATQDVAAGPSTAVVEEKGTTVVIIATVAGVTVVSSMLAGIVTIALPVMAKDLEIPEALLLW